MPQEKIAELEKRLADLEKVINNPHKMRFVVGQDDGNIFLYEGTLFLNCNAQFEHEGGYVALDLNTFEVIDPLDVEAAIERLKTTGTPLWWQGKRKKE